MLALKSPGLDGLLVLFYKKYWATVGDDVVKAMSSFFKTGN